MTTNEDLFQDAMKTGYLRTDLNNAELIGRWSIVARAHGFPFVLVTDRSRGVLVSCKLDENRMDTRINTLRAKRTCKKALTTGQESTLLIDPNEIGGIYPEPVALALARRLARLSGQQFPLTENQVLAPFLEGRVAP